MPVSGGARAATGFFTADEVAEILHLHVKRVQALARDGRLPAVRVGRKWLFPQENLLAMLRTAGVWQRAPEEESEMEISARNQLRGKVTAVSFGGVMAEVRLDIGGQDLVAVITRASAERLGIKVGTDAVAIIKATEVMIGKP
jgi:molybdopterin-binding protein